MNDLTIDELCNHYLWFSKRSGFKDKFDANIGAFIEDTPQIERGLLLIYTEEGVKELVRLMDNTGICCFTKEFPQRKELCHFPNGEDSICIEYDKGVLESFFLNDKFALAHPFKDVIYSEEPTKMDTDGTYHILTKRHKDGCEYTSIYQIFSDIKKVDWFVGLLLTRIHKRFWRQKETRIILGGRNLDFFEENVTGFKIDIPQNAINRVFVFNRKESFCLELDNIESLRGKIVYVNDY